MATCIIRKMWTHTLMVEVVLDPFTLFWKCLIIFMITGCSSLPSPFTHRFDQQLPEFLHDTSLLSVPQFLAKCYVKWICKNSRHWFLLLPSMISFILPPSSPMKKSSKSDNVNTMHLRKYLCWAILVRKHLSESFPKLKNNKKTFNQWHRQ